MPLPATVMRALRRRLRSVRSAPRTLPQASVDGWPEAATLTRPHGDEIGRRGAWYFVERRTRWDRRHVEQIDMTNDVSARRRLTVDVLLPHDPEPSLPWQDGLRLFYMPVAMLRKAPATSNLDFVDEEGRSLPILNRYENAQITRVALDTLIRREVDIPSSAVDERLRRFLRDLVTDTELDEQRARVVNLVTLLQLLGAVGPRFDRVHQLIRDVAANSVLWTAIVGTPGQRRILKLSYDHTLYKPPILRERPGLKEVRLEVDGVERYFEVFDPGDGSERSIAKRLWNRLALTVGWAAYDVDIDSPALRETASYHLEFQPPAGVEVRSIRLHATLVDSADERRFASSHDDDRDRAHLHFAGLRVKREGRAEVRMRVGRRGFLTYSLVFASAVALLLWAFENEATAASTRTNAQVSAAVLLFTPTLLGLFLLRPGEHELAARLLSGIRGLVVSSGLLCVAAAMGLVGVLPPTIATLPNAWRLEAILATVVAAVLLVSWILAFDSFEHLRKASADWLFRYRRFMLSAFALIVGVLLVLFASPHDAGAGDVRHDLPMTLMVIFAVVAGWVAQFADVNYADERLLGRRRIAAVCLGLSSLGLILCSLSLSDLDGSLDTWATVRPIAISAAAAAALLLVVLEVSRRFDDDEGESLQLEPVIADYLA